MNKYLNDITTIIRDCSMVNTYKMSWIRSIVEYCSKNPNSSIIHFDDLSRLIFKYFGIKQYISTFNKVPIQINNLRYFK